MISWTYKCTSDEIYPVLPDGCQDFIIKKSMNGEKSFFVTDLQDSSIFIRPKAGEEYLGIRILPGNQIDIDKIQKIETPKAASDLKNIALELSNLDTNLSEVLDCLSHFKAPQKVASELGVSLRTLQRYVKKHTGKNPEFWRQLARARKAAQLLLAENSAISVSLDCLYADQAHLAREIKRWFGITPNFIQKHSRIPNHWIHQLYDKGYDMPLTGEQISIKKPL